MLSFSQNPQYIPLNGKEKIRIVFLFQIASLWPSWESFYYACRNDMRFDVRMVLLDKPALHDMLMKTSRDFLISNNIDFIDFDGFDFDTFKPHVLVIQTPYELFHRMPGYYSIDFIKKGARVIYIPYGIEFPDTEQARADHFYGFTVNNCWRIYTLSEATQAEYIRYCPNRGSVRAFGHPKLDGLTDKTRFRLDDDIISLIAGRKTFLLKLHFPKEVVEGGKFVQITPDMHEYILFADYVQEHRELFFILSLHPGFLKLITNEGLKRQALQLLKRYSGLDNVFIYKHNDYRPALLNPDAIIIDRSALMIEAAAAGVPILYMSNKDFTEPLIKPVEALLNTYEHGATSKDMAAFVESFINNGDKSKADRQAAFEGLVQYFDGKNGERIKNDIAESLEKERENSNGKKRLVIFGLGQAFEYYWKNTKIFDSEKYDIVALSDNDSKKWGASFEEIRIVEPDKLRDITFDMLVIGSEFYYMDIIKQLAADVKIDIDKIMRFDVFASKSQEDYL